MITFSQEFECIDFDAQQYISIALSGYLARILVNVDLTCLENNVYLEANKTFFHGIKQTKTETNQSCYMFLEFDL